MTRYSPTKCQPLSTCHTQNLVGCIIQVCTLLLKILFPALLIILCKIWVLFSLQLWFWTHPGLTKTKKRGHQLYVVFCSMNLEWKKKNACGLPVRYSRMKGIEYLWYFQASMWIWNPKSEKGVLLKLGYPKLTYGFIFVHNLLCSVEEFSDASKKLVYFLLGTENEYNVFLINTTTYSCISSRNFWWVPIVFGALSGGAGSIEETQMMLPHGAYIQLRSDSCRQIH